CFILVLSMQVLSQSFDCMSSACLNASTCNTRINGSCSCVCASGCPSCESCDPCTPNPCLNDGCTCNPSEEHSMGYYCHGDAGYLGKNCEINPPSLECSAGTIALEVPEEIVTTKYLKGTKVYIAVGDAGLSHQNADPVCFTCKSQVATNGKYKITIPIPFLNCNNMIADSPNGERVISNTIWLNKEEPNRAFDVPVPIGTFKCRYSKDYQVITSLSPIVSNPWPVTKKLNSFSSRLVLCKMPICPNTCPTSHVLDNTAVYTAGELIYVHMYHTEAIQQNHFSLETLFLSCSPTNFNSGKINLVLNGCLAGESGKLLDFRLQQTNPSTVCLSFRAPMMKVCKTIYIHALVKRCRYGIIEACPGDSVTRR
uniref:ZP domain-containing protein n=1 Tax=Ciona intestinalis TaxID=7719 RepID=H2XQQ1_CIOIN